MHNHAQKPYTLIFRFSKKEAADLFERARIQQRRNGLEIRTAPKTGTLARLLIVIGRKAGNAPQRNLMRRRLKNIFYQQALYNGKLDGIILVYHEAILLSFQELTARMLKVFSDT